MFKLGVIVLTWGLFTKILSAEIGTQQKCGTNFWQCADGTCIFMVGRCDNYPDCPDNSDEKGCSSVVCREGQRPCSSGECINAKFFCDGIINCKDAGDELAADCRGENIPKSNASKSTEILEPPPLKIITWTPYPIQDTTSLPVTSKTTETQKHLPPTPVNKPTSLPDIIVPVNIHTQSQVQSRNRFLTTPKPSVPDWTGSIHREAPTTRFQTTPYWHNWYNTTYQPTTSRTPCVEVDDRFEFCRKRYRGYYRHPNDCRQYIVCEWGFMYICTCPDLTHWDLRALTCVWEHTSPCITGQYDRPIIPDLIARGVTPTPLIPITLPATTQKSSTTTPAAPDIIPPLVRLRALPATPAWLKELTVKTFSQQNQTPTPLYQSLLTRFFKALPQESTNQNIRMS